VFRARRFSQANSSGQIDRPTSGCGDCPLCPPSMRGAWLPTGSNRVAKGSRQVLMPVSVPVRGCKPLTANPVNRSTKSRIEVKHYYFSSWIFFRKEAGLCFRPRSWQVYARAEPRSTTIIFISLSAPPGKIETDWDKGCALRDTPQWSSAAAWVSRMVDRIASSNAAAGAERDFCSN
jgi:hypothetical protein